MENGKNILMIGDVPGYGKMGLAGMLPILSNMGHSVYNLPTALVSNNFDYGKFSVLDTTEYMRETIQVWRTLGFQFDCITTGFLASADQESYFSLKSESSSMIPATFTPAVRL